jgi:hypothetical protein
MNTIVEKARQSLKDKGLPDLFDVILTKFLEPPVPMSTMDKDKGDGCRNERLKFVPNLVKLFRCASRWG